MNEPAFRSLFLPALLLAAVGSFAGSRLSASATRWISICGYLLILVLGATILLR